MHYLHVSTFTIGPIEQYPKWINKGIHRRNPPKSHMVLRKEIIIIYTYMMTHIHIDLFVWIPMRHQWPVSHIDLKGLGATNTTMAEAIHTWYRAKFQPIISLKVIFPYSLVTPYIPQEPFENHCHHPHPLARPSSAFCQPPSDGAAWFLVSRNVLGLIMIDLIYLHLTAHVWKTKILSIYKNFVFYDAVFL